MPELPEVETVRRGLAEAMVGHKIEGLVVTGVRTVRRHDQEDLVATAVGRNVVDMRRLGKFLLVDLDGDQTIVMHLRMSGQLRWHLDSSDPLTPHTHAIFRMDDGGEVRFVDPRTFGELWLTTSDVPELWHIGPDAYEALPTAAELSLAASNRRIAIKTFLLDQRAVAGIGNIYADESLFEAKLRPDRSVASLTKHEWRQMRSAVRSVIDQAVEHRGSTLADRQYVDLMGEAGSAQSMHKVYARGGRECLRCGGLVETLKVGGRTSSFCPSCQH